MADDDLAQVSNLHRQALDHGLFPRLGHNFLARYLATFVDSPHCSATVADADGHVAGFVVATLDPVAQSRWLRRNALLALLLHGVGALLVRPRLLLTFLTTRLGRYLRGLRRRVQGPRASTAGISAPAVLHHVAVHPWARGRGLGARLVADVATAAAAAGAREVRLITPAGGEAEGFYERHGWRRMGSRDARDGEQVAEFSLPLEGA